MGYSKRGPEVGNRKVGPKIWVVQGGSHKWIPPRRCPKRFLNLRLRGLVPEIVPQRQSTNCLPKQFPKCGSSKMFHQKGSRLVFKKGSLPIGAIRQEESPNGGPQKVVPQSGFLKDGPPRGVPAIPPGTSKGATDWKLVSPCLSSSIEPGPRFPWIPADRSTDHYSLIQLVGHRPLQMVDLDFGRGVRLDMPLPPQLAVQAYFILNIIGKVCRRWARDRRPGIDASVAPWMALVSSSTHLSIASSSIAARFSGSLSSTQH